MLLGWGSRGEDTSTLCCDCSFVVLKEKGRVGRKERRKSGPERFVKEKRGQKKEQRKSNQITDRNTCEYSTVLRLVFSRKFHFVVRRFLIRCLLVGCLSNRRRKNLLSTKISLPQKNLSHQQSFRHTTLITCTKIPQTRFSSPQYSK